MERLQPAQPLIRIHVVQRAKQLLLRVHVPRRAIAADAHAHRSRAAPFALRLPHGVQHALADSLERSIGAAEMIELRRQRVLRIRVLAAAAFEDQLDLDGRFFPLIEMDDRRARPEVVAGVHAGNRIDRVWPELASLRGFGDGLTNLLLHPDLIGAHRNLDLERRHAGVLADRPLARLGLIDVLCNHGQRLARPRPRRFGRKRQTHRRAHIGGQIGGRPGDEFDHAVEKGWKHVGSIIRSGRSSGTGDEERDGGRRARTRLQLGGAE